MSDSINDITNEKISSLLDGEQTLDDSLMSSLSTDEAKAKWARYNLVSDVLNDRDQHSVSSSWFTELSDKLDNEPAVLAPRVTRTFKQRVMKQVAGFAVAASVAMVAIVSVQQTRIADNDATTSIASTNPNITNSGDFSSSNIKPVTLRLNKATESRLSGYLVNHYEHSVSGKMLGVMPYMRIVSVTPAERIVNEK